ncbi:MACPF domain-containing protein [Madurella fahalii]|uniref:MACPF domain-containing protein n=1 Tax=Madurella fahalii TaxID=1157608 RepID=A0ABQ0GFT7_9PEZI
MTEQDWNRVIRNNSLMNGNVFSIVENKSREKEDKLEFITKVEKAPYPAFKLKPRTFERHELDMKSDINVNTEYYMPRYLVADDSYVDVFETADAISTSLASSSFSQTDIEGSIGGGAGGFSGEVKAGFSKGTQEAISKAASEKTRTMNITYNFPRVVIYFDKWSVELTTQCAKELGDIESTQDLVEWHQKFGQFFARRVELGGRLFSSESSSNISGASASEKANRMKIAASASFSSPFVQASASASHQTESTDKEAQAQSRLNKSISWRAQGGNTLLANNPPAWCSTVGPYENWRICQQSDVTGMLDFIRTLSPDLRATVDEKLKYKVGGDEHDSD